MANRLPIFTPSKDGAAASLNPKAGESEDYMQALVSTHPEIIADDDGGLLLNERGNAMGNGDVAGRWPVDHLFVTRGAVPALVGPKRAVQEAAE